MANPLIALEKLGQSFWLDYISRTILENGELNKLIEEDHLKGVTSNPAIFEKAIAKTSDYDEAIAKIHHPVDAKTIYEKLAIKDIQEACDLLQPVFQSQRGLDGFSCLEVSPHLAFDALGTIEEGKRLWHEVNRPNLMVKVPGTKAGMQSIRALISEGINVNVTLLFSTDAYKDAALAFLLGLKDRADKSLPIESVHSVASFFISRIDSKIDAKLLAISRENKDPQQKNLAQNLMGTVAIANAKLAYLNFTELYQSDLAKELLKKGAAPQRLLWASTSTKNEHYSDVLYVENLIAPTTVNTMPLETINAFRHHGHAQISLNKNIDGAHEIFDHLAQLGIDFSSACDELLKEGIQLFISAFDQLLAAVRKKSSTITQ